jgi:O-antigen/teichoic acid export membrane protein
MATETSPLRTLAVKSTAWYGASRVWGQLVSWGVTVLLARLLVPGDYGLFAMALSVLMVLELLQEFGLGVAIIQKRDLTRQQVNGVFWVVTATSLVLTAATFLAAGPISAFYAEPRLTWALRILCLTFLLNSVGMIPYNLLTKALNLQRRAIAEGMGTAAAALIALGLAYMGFGVWSLVLGHLGRAIVLNTALLIFAGWLPGLEVARDGMRDVITFGLRIAGMHIVGNISPAVATFIVGRLMGGTALGLYGMAQSLAEGPHRVSTGIINQVSFPVFSKLQDDREELANYFLKISKYLGLITLPAQVGLVLVAPDVVPLLLSSKWEAVVVPFQIICLESAVVMMTLTASPLLTALGRASFMLRRSFLSLASMSAATFIGVPFGLAGVALARLAVMVPLRLTLLVPCLWALEVPFRVYLRTLASPFFSTAVMAAAVVGVRHVMADSGLWERAVASAVVGAVSYVGALLVLDRNLVHEVHIMAHDLLSRTKA